MTEQASFSNALDALKNQVIVLDLQSQYVCIGTLVEVDHRYLILAEADLHDLRDSTTTRERYVLETREHGVRSNRQKILIRHDEVVGLSALTDVIA